MYVRISKSWETLVIYSNKCDSYCTTVYCTSSDHEQNMYIPLVYDTVCTSPIRLHSEFHGFLSSFTTGANIKEASESGKK